MHADVRSFGRLFVRPFVDPFVGSFVRSLVRRFVRLLVRPFARAAAEERGERRGTLSQAGSSSGRSGDSNFCRNLRNGHHLVRSSCSALLCFSLFRSNRQMGARQMHVVASGSGAYFVHSYSGFPLCTSLLLLLVALQS